MRASVAPARRPFPLFIAGIALTQILGWGTTFYLPSILDEPIGRDLGAGLVGIGLSTGPVSYLASWLLFGLATPLALSIGSLAAVTQSFPERGRRGLSALPAGSRRKAASTPKHAGAWPT